MRSGYQFTKTKAFSVCSVSGTNDSHLPGTKSTGNSQKKPFAIDLVNGSVVLPTKSDKVNTGAVGDDDIYSIQAQITKQQSVIKQIKKDGVSSDVLTTENEKLAELRNKLAALEKNIAPVEVLNRKAFDELILRKMYVVPSFEIHNGPAGLFDYGPPACALKANVLALWRQHFVLEENMLEMECTNLTPSSVLETSGHVERFTDFMVRDEKTGECFRADKLLEEVIDQVLAANPGMPSEEQDTHLIVQ
eukprot:gene37853-49607_t